MQLFLILALLHVLITAAAVTKPPETKPAADEKPQTKPAENEHKWSSYLIQKLNLHRCLLLSAKIHYLNRLKTKRSQDEGETKEESNEVTIQLATLTRKYRLHGCVELQEGTHFLRAVVSVFSELLALPPRKHHQQHEGQLKPAFGTFPETQDSHVEVVPNDDGAQESRKYGYMYTHGKFTFPFVDKKPASDKDKKPVEKPADGKDKKPVDEKDKKPVDEKDKKPVEKPADNKDKKPADEKDKKPVDEKDKKPVEKPADNKDKKPVDEKDKKPVSEKDKKPTEEKDTEPADDKDKKPQQTQ